MVCEDCPNPAKHTMYKDFGHEVRKIDCCNAHYYVMQQLGYKEAVLEDWTVNFEHIPSDTFLDKLRRKFKRLKP